MGKSAEAVKEFIESIAVPLGYEVLEVAYSKKFGELNLTVYIGRERAVTLDDCERVHNAIDAPLDEFDPTGGAPYILNVSSYGIDRPLKTARDYERATGSEVEVAVFNSVCGKKRVVGVLKSFDEGAVTVIPEGGEPVVIGRKNISKIKPYIRFE
ncbi:MAG: ribosome maturation factor RimP [Clostridiales bacterium]|jgi:ribosome maturation factor RimP|nr:ribosome maturation factor RimP [Clostridiales bacterium]